MFCYLLWLFCDFFSVSNSFPINEHLCLQFLLVLDHFFHLVAVDTGLVGVGWGLGLRGVALRRSWADQLRLATHTWGCQMTASSNNLSRCKVISIFVFVLSHQQLFRYILSRACCLFVGVFCTLPIQMLCLFLASLCYCSFCPLLLDWQAFPGQSTSQVLSALDIANIFPCFAGSLLIFFQG